MKCTFIQYFEKYIDWILSGKKWGSFDLEILRIYSWYHYSWYPLYSNSVKNK